MTSTLDPPGINVAQRDLSELLRELTGLAKTARQSGQRTTYGHGVFVLPGRRLLVTPRVTGDSRYPFVREGMNFWVYGSGYMHANDGLFAIFPRRTEGQEPGIAFMAAMRAGAGWQPFPLLGVPHTPEDDLVPAERFAVFAPTHACYVTRKSGLAFLVRVVPLGAGELSFGVHVENEGREHAELLLSAFFNPMLRHQIHETDEDRWFRTITVAREAHHDATFTIQVNEDKDRHTSLSQEARIVRRYRRQEGVTVRRVEETPSRLQYMGAVSRSLASATSLRAGSFGDGRDLCSFIEPAIAADMAEVLLAPGGCLQVEYRFRVSGEPGEGGCDGGSAHEAGIVLDHHDRQEAQRASAIVLRCDGSRDSDIRAEVFTDFFAHLMKQVEFCSLIRGYVQLSENSLVGIRDVFQALEGLAYWRPDAARAKMLEALSFTLEDGRCLRQYSLPNKNGQPGRADVRPFIDQGAWVISTIATHIQLTGDTAFLAETCGYHRLVEGRVVPSSQCGTVMDHLRRILSYMLAQLDSRTGCLRALHGDWNDALDGLGILPGGGDGYGNGVSVMASLQLLRNLREMRALLHVHGTPSGAAEMEPLRTHESSLANSLWRHGVDRAPDESLRIMHGWGHDGAYRVGSFRDADGKGRDSLASNAFWVLCGMLERHPETRDGILSAFERLDSKYGLRTFQPCFPAGDERFGRIGKLPPGTAENAGTYVHATLFGIMALFEMGEPRRAWEQLAKVLPFTPLHRNLSHSPFVMPNSYGYNPGLGIDGQNMNDWQTGSSNVLLKTILRHAIGFRMEWDELVLRPANWSPFQCWEIALTARGRRFQIHYEDKGLRRRAFEVNGAARETHFNPQDKAHGIRLGLDNLPASATIAITITD